MLPPDARDCCRPRLGCLLTCLCAPVCWTQQTAASEIQRAAAQREPFPGARFVSERRDVVAFVGRADVESAQHAGHLEALLAARYRGLEVRFRNFGWEGDTVHARPRDASAPDQTRRAAVETLAAFGGAANEKVLLRLAGGAAPSVQSAAIASLCGFDRAAAARLASQSFAHLSKEAELSEVFGAFLQ